MLNAEATEKLKALASEACAREGCVLYDLDTHGSIKHRVIRVFVDCDAASVTIEQCANISQALSLRLDVEDIIPGGAYDLEVSSPGLERVLREPRHFAKSVGQNIKLVLDSPLMGAEKFGVSISGTLTSATEEQIVLQSKETDLAIPYQLIKRAQTVYDFNKKR